MARQDIIAEAARRLYKADQHRCCSGKTSAARRINAADIGRACGLTIQCPGSMDNPNLTVEAIVAAADALAAAEGGLHVNRPTQKNGDTPRDDARVVLWAPEHQFYDDIAHEVR